MNKKVWIFIVDLFAILMVIFLLVGLNAINENNKLKNEKEKMVQSLDVERLKELLEENKEVSKRENERKEISKEINGGIRDLLKDMGASFNEGELTITFLEPSYTFEISDYKIKKSFEERLRNFLYGYSKVIIKHKNNIDSVKIIGHTSSEWFKREKTKENLEDDFMRNMLLSQQRTNSIYSFWLSNTDLEFSKWMRKNVNSVGMSSSQLIYNKNLKEDKQKSRRIEFKIILK